MDATLAGPRVSGGAPDHRTTPSSTSSTVELDHSHRGHGMMRTLVRVAHLRPTA